MEEHKEREEIKSILSRGKKLSAPIDMSDRVLLNWKKESDFVEPKPLISKWIWMLIALSIGILVVLTSGIESPGTTEFPLSQKLNALKSEINIPTLKVNLVMMISLTVLGLMFFINAFLIRSRSKFNSVI